MKVKANEIVRMINERIAQIEADIKFSINEEFDMGDAVAREVKDAEYWARKEMRAEVAGLEWARMAVGAQIYAEQIEEREQKAVGCMGGF